MLSRMIVERAARFSVLTLWRQMITQASETTTTESTVIHGEAFSNHAIVAPAPANAAAGSASGSTQHTEQARTVADDVAVAVTPTRVSLVSAETGKSKDFVINLFLPACSRRSGRRRTRLYSNAAAVRGRR